jgi:zinc protease
MINRKTSPAVKEIKSINFVRPENYKLQNGINTYLFSSQNSPVIKLDVIFNAGIEKENIKLQSVFANSLLKEAPIGMTSNETAEYFDFYGAFIESFTGNDTGGLRLYVPQRYFGDVLPIFADLFKNPLLPEKEFEILQTKNREAIRNNLRKTKYNAMKGLNNQLFGDDHPRGALVSPDDSTKIILDDIQRFVKDYYSSANCFIQIAGMADSTTVDLCNRYFGSKFGNTEIKTHSAKLARESNNYLKYIEMPDAVQSSIYIGKNLGKLNEDELIDIGILNTVLGGYFGSRLMKNIREDKGYTYGIGSFLAEYNDCIALKITADVGADVTKNAIDEIFKEIEKLQTSKIPASELKLVQNFISGDMLAAFDGVFQTAAIWEKLITTGRSAGYIKKQTERVRNISSADLLKCAQKHFGKEGFHTVVAGKM